MSTKIVEDFLRSGTSVCPFAKSNRHLIVEVDREPVRSQRDIRRTCQKYAQTRGKKPPRALILVGPALDGFEATQAWAHACYVELGTGLRIASGEEALAARLHGQRMLEWLLDDAAPTRPFLTCGLAPVHCICMAPVYPTEHPRFSRAAMVVVTWVTAVGEVPMEQRLPIRQEAEARAGGAYDADAYLIPVDLPPLDVRVSQRERIMFLSEQ